MKYVVTLESTASNPDTKPARVTVELEATNVKEVRSLARAQNPGTVVKQVRRQKQQTTNAA